MLHYLLLGRCGLISAFTKTRRKGWPTAETAYDLWQQLRQQEDTVLDDASAYATGAHLTNSALLMKFMPLWGKPQLLHLATLELAGCFRHVHTSCGRSCR